MKYLFNQVFFLPLYNALVFLSGIMPGHSLGLAIIVLTLLVKIVLFPLYHKTTTTQAKLKLLEPELKKIKAETTDNRQLQAQKIMELYRVHGVSPFAGIGVMLIQLPILWALYKVFRGSFEFDGALVYSFINAPSSVNHFLFGILDLTATSYILALLVGLSQYIQVRLALPPVKPDLVPNNNPSFSDNLSKSMGMQMRYILPVMMIVISAGLPAALPLYWLVGNIFQIGHEVLVKRKAFTLLQGERPQA